MSDRIFVSIAAYRDSDLAQTIADLASHAAQPERLVIALLEQSDAPLPKSSFPSEIALIHDHCRAEESRGVGWARARAQQKFGGEDFYLQLDAHHRFAPGWDKALRKELARCPSANPVLSGYLPPVIDDGPADATGGALHASHFDHEGVLNLKSHPIAGNPAASPVPGSYVSGHFIFASGDFVRRVPYDPDFYFFGEEVSMSARAFTHGFDVFHPRRVGVRHRYGREGARRHWDDHSAWTVEQRRSLDKWAHIFAPEPYIAAADGLGTHRSLAEFEQWTGVDFRWRVIHSSALNGAPPPSAAQEGWALAEGLVQSRTLHIALPALADEPHESVYIAIRDATPRDAFVLRQSAREYAALQTRGLRAHVRFKQAPLSVVVLPFGDGKWRAPHEWMLPEE